MSKIGLNDEEMKTLLDIYSWSNVYFDEYIQNLENYQAGEPEMIAMFKITIFSLKNIDIKMGVGVCWKINRLLQTLEDVVERLKPENLP